MAFSGIIIISYFHSFYVEPFINTLNCSKNYTQVSFYRIRQSKAESYSIKEKINKIKTLVWDQKLYANIITGQDGMYYK